MAPARLLDRNIRPAKRQTEEYSDDDVSQEEAGGSESEDVGSDASALDEDDRSDLDEDEVAEEDEESVQDPERLLSNVSFGALKHAQDSLSRKRKRTEDPTPDQDAKLDALRERLRQLREKKAGKIDGKGKQERSAKTRVTAQESAQDEDDVEDQSDSDSDAPSEEAAPTSRGSKHAPMSQSTKNQVTRKRQVIDLPNRKIRDPRFDALHSSAAHPGDSANKAYAFLHDYQASEVAELKAALKNTKDEHDKETLKRKIGSMENQRRTREAKERQQAVLRAHRKEERAKVEQGKNPYYLKKGELRERALVEKFKRMKGKDREKAVEKRRLRESQKEKKRMPEARRMPAS